MPAPRWRPTASISSMKMMEGAAFLACAKRSRTRDAPTPTNISTKSEPEMVKNGTPGLAGDGLGKQRLARAGRADEQHALGDARADVGELGGVFQELHDLAQLFLLLIGAGNVLEGDVVGPCGSVRRARLLPKLAMPLPLPVWARMTKT